MVCTAYMALRCNLDAMIRKFTVAAVVLLAPLRLSGQELSPTDRVDIYGSCYPACQKAQRANPQNRPALDTPFLLDAYCSCTCARMVFQLQGKEQVAAVARAQKQGRLQQYLRTDPSISNLQTHNAVVCQRALLGD